MKKLMPNQWSSFQENIASMPLDSSSQEILSTILNWIEQYPEIFSERPFSDYQLNSFLKLKEKNISPPLLPPFHLNLERFKE